MLFNENNLSAIMLSEGNLLDSIFVIVILLIKIASEWCGLSH